jgi:hypothetical protein
MALNQGGFAASHIAEKIDDSRKTGGGDTQ